MGLSRDDGFGPRPILGCSKGCHWSLVCPCSSRSSRRRCDPHWLGAADNTKAKLVAQGPKVLPPAAAEKLLFCWSWLGPSSLLLSNKRTLDAETLHGAASLFDFHRNTIKAASQPAAAFKQTHMTRKHSFVTDKLLLLQKKKHNSHLM